MEPAWSPDGKTIAYVSTASFWAGQLQLINADDGAPIKLPAAMRADCRMFFHPDGRRLLGRFGLASPPDRVAWFDLKTGVVKPVEKRPGDPVVVRAPFCFSPDGCRTTIKIFHALTHGFCYRVQAVASVECYQNSKAINGNYQQTGTEGNCGSSQDPIWEII
ncbi:MAG: hypothetical protein EXS30_00640, partial [Pedosphaera sp.]|nr:hypothetical protein [Pedosphaera sp.]